MTTSDTWKARIGDIILADKRFKCGSAFLLSKNPHNNYVYAADGKWSVEVSPSCRYIVAKCTNDLAENNIFDIAYRMCQRALDVWAFSHTLLATTEDVLIEYLLWWRIKRKTVVRSYSVARSGMNVSAKVEVRDKNGKLIIRRMPSPIYHDSLRFFRLSQVTDDLFDAFRNMYLCFECLLSHKYPRKKK